MGFLKKLPALKIWFGSGRIEDLISHTIFDNEDIDNEFLSIKFLSMKDFIDLYS